ncbi:hypothetical protein [Alkalihalophilus marmarensis]|uniref:Uncharacterized protein n=1 Tax=Alkalihalophilus marmarensis DSM 21297 TaxID=1188261 RepID=U6SUH1_9BACI|nr:hypothetical protein [Alkalihalophilus marmarensis]ERN54311.1 hypothetical protein A33I_07745 [Alkalihalophilus marmarensis DSM 21297]
MVEKSALNRKLMIKELHEAEMISEQIYDSLMKELESDKNEL